MSSIYIHIPFCSRKCPYCDFYSQVGSREQIVDYITLLKSNIRILAGDRHNQGALETVFFGGGTPSLLEAQQLEQILSELHRGFGIAEHAEISLEANPGTINLTKLQGFRQAGVNRLSLGIQSLDDANLSLLGRIHSKTEALSGFNAARRAGFDNISLDLIFALPGQTLEDNAREVNSLLALNPEHLALYGLSYEPGTPLSEALENGTIIPSSDEMYAAHYRQIHHLMSAAGYEHYEISNFAKPGYRCRHNQVYWRRDNCLAAGCGGHGFDATGWGRRWMIPADIARFTSLIAAGENPAEDIETFDLATAMSEYCYLRLRTRDGLELNEFKQRFSRDPEVVFAKALRHCGKHLETSPGRVRFNLDGWLIYDHLISAFL